MDNLSVNSMPQIPVVVTLRDGSALGRGKSGALLFLKGGDRWMIETLRIFLKRLIIAPFTLFLCIISYPLWWIMGGKNFANEGFRKFLKAAWEKNGNG